jgi:hypothetical protein
MSSGQLDIQGYAPECPAWEKLQDVVDDGEHFKPFQHPCDASGNCVEYHITGTCKESAGHTAAWNKYSVRCPIASTVKWNSGNHGQVFRMVTENGSITSNGIMHFSWGGRRAQGSSLWFWPENRNDTEVSSILAPGTTMQLHYDGQRYKTIKVSPQAASCWGPGTDIVLSSHTKFSSDKQLAKVISADIDAGTLTLDSLIEKPITVADHPDFAVEIASLNRPVVFEADSDQGNEQIGGHLMIHHTNTVSICSSNFK